jgi:hypothetical protein
MSNLINCGTCGYPLTPEERSTLVERDGVMMKPAPVHPDSDRIDWLTNNPVDALDLFGHVKGAEAVRWIRQEIDKIRLKEKNT